ncbi:restriction endonuclease [Rhizobium leguminosarum]|uniref:restriction endonuclease n=1 Tax=Rhizobium leguminosarum TaxID=384 RepID=UPI001C903266|nr:restriction endonuclease [Rhizobium leguminosarum]MBY2994498.1 restriction endonuclease [Rhizobium leguminosarum]MBY3058926.1 restriction endonuclease [Rhizobium leguminosarum]
MPVLDFTEIPEAHLATGHQDTFELFARDFFKFEGYEIAADPDRGADGGSDITLLERRVGVGGETLVRWLVSCKHKASSGRSVSPTDDSNISDRVRANGCDGFVGFYSTLPSSGLSKMVSGLGIPFQIFDREKIEGQLLHSSRGLELAKRYFPKSIEAWSNENPTPARLFKEHLNLPCANCGTNLLEKPGKGIVSLWQKMRESPQQKDAFEQIHFTCFGHCDDVIGKRLRADKLIDGWEDIRDISIPTVYIRWVMSVLNELRSGVTYSDQAFENLKELLLQLFPYVARHPTAAESDRLRELGTIPSWMGGLGYSD